MSEPFIAVVGKQSYAIRFERIERVFDFPKRPIGVCKWNGCETAELAAMAGTQFGRIANLTQTVSEPPSPLLLQLEHITRRISLLAIGLGIIVTVVSIAQLRMDWIEALLLGVGLVVAFIPEGLRPLVTLTLAMAGQRLADKGVLIKQMSTIETLGATSVICTDKSGTLTQNQMTVREVWVAQQRLSITGAGYEPKGVFIPLPFGLPYEADLNLLLIGALCCNNSRLNPPTPDRPQWTSLGDQTEAAMKVAAMKEGITEEAVNRILPRIHELPFDARRKRMTFKRFDSPNPTSRSRMSRSTTSLNSFTINFSG